MVYCNRVWEHVIFRQELDALTARLDLHLVHVLGEPAPGWQGERGLLSRELLARHFDAGAREWHFFVCGPTPMIRIAERGLRDLGVVRSRVHSEIFDLA